MRTLLRAFLLVLASAALLQAQSPKVFTYVGRITPESFLVAWGTAEGKGNSIGRGSLSMGEARVEADGRSFASARNNWVEVTGLAPDKDYAYRVLVDGRLVGSGQVRTFPRSADRLSFFLIGDFGTGRPPQYEIARVMEREFERKRASDSPVRFVLTTGDNLYADRLLGIFPPRDGVKDADWRRKFFEPYEKLLREIPFYPTVGNHDRDEAFSTYLDNFFLPSDDSALFYSFSFGGLADFFALDTTVLASRDPSEASLAEGGGQFRWLTEAVGSSRGPWKIAYFHHPPFSAGPNHDAAYDQLSHVVRLFRDNGIQAVFSGHEHNFQLAERNAITGRTQYVVSGAGGQLRPGRTYSKMRESGIAGVAPQRHFLLVEIDGENLTITPLAGVPVVVRDADRKPIPIPMVVKRRDFPEGN